DANARREVLWVRSSSCIYIYTTHAKRHAVLPNAKIGHLRRNVKEEEKTALSRGPAVCELSMFRNPWKRKRGSIRHIRPNQGLEHAQALARHGRHGRLLGLDC